jgi:flagellar biosynthetic protein FliP
MVLIGLALFLTFFVMQPVLNDAWTTGLLPLTEGRVGEIEGLRLAIEPFRRFMTANLRQADLQLFLDIAHLPAPAVADDTPWRALVPAFLVGELRRAVEMGFLLFLPFMVIDMSMAERSLCSQTPEVGAECPNWARSDLRMVASVLMLLGMMMLPPSVVSLPFKLIFFVLVEGWRLVSGSLVQSFSSAAP